MKIGEGMQLGDMVEFSPTFFGDEAREAARRFLTPWRLLLRLIDYLAERIARNKSQTIPPR